VGYAKIEKDVAIRAYKRGIKDVRGLERDRIDIRLYTDKFPKALENAIKVNGFIDKWAFKVNFDASLPPSIIEDESPKKRKSSGPDLCVEIFTNQKEYEENQSSFWFVSINDAFSDSFWVEWVAAIDHMRFCIGLGSKTNAYVRCSSTEDAAVFTTSGKFTYEALPCIPMEEKNTFPCKVCHVISEGIH
jgi:hypothetical protein